MGGNPGLQNCDGRPEKKGVLVIAGYIKMRERSYCTSVSTGVSTAKQNTGHEHGHTHTYIVAHGAPVGRFRLSVTGRVVLHKIPQGSIV